METWDTAFESRFVLLMMQTTGLKEGSTTPSSSGKFRANHFLNKLNLYFYSKAASTMVKSGVTGNSWHFLTKFYSTSGEVQLQHPKHPCEHPNTQSKHAVVTHTSCLPHKSEQRGWLACTQLSPGLRKCHGPRRNSNLSTPVWNNNHQC